MVNNSSYENEMQDSMARFVKQENVEIKNCPVEVANDIWNAAIEKAANTLKSNYPEHAAVNAYCACVRSLKK